MKKLKIIILFIALPFNFLLPQAINIGLNDAIGLALQNNDRIKQFEEKLKQKEYSELESWGNFLPKFDFETSYNHLNDDMSIDLNPIRDVIINIQSKNQVEFANIYSLMNAGTPLSADQKSALRNQFLSQLNGMIPSFTETFKKQDFKKASLTGVQPLFMGGKILAAKNFASAEKEAALADLLKTKNEIVNETVVNYSRALLLKSMVQTRKNVLNGIQKHKEDARILYEQGIIANYHMLRAEVAVAEAERNLLTDVNNFELALLSLKKTIGLTAEAEIFLTDSLIYKEINNPLENYLNDAHENQPVLKIIEEKKKAANQGYKVALSAFMPQIAAFGKYEMYPEYLSALEPRWAVGVQLNLNLFNGMKDYCRLQSAAHLENEILFIESDTKKKIDLWIHKSYREMENSKTRFEKLSSAYSLAVENLRQNEKRFQNGMATSLEVIDAQLSLEKVEVDRLVSLYEYYISAADLFLAAGKPLEVLNIWNN